MKNFFIYLSLIGVLTACENRPFEEFEDYALKTVYFPYQLPLRTLSMGEDRIDNSLDKEGKFDIGISIGGMYENKWEWTADYVVDNSLTKDVYTKADSALKILPLPEEYYSLAPQNHVKIPKGLFNGMIRVELNDAFFEDSISITGRYVIPLRLTGTNAGGILTGEPVSSVTNPDPRISSHWGPDKSPKNWVMYGIKYINQYHGTYLHRGRDIKIETATGNPVDTVVFRNKYVERDILMKLITSGRNKVISDGIGNRTGGEYSMTLEFGDESGTSEKTITIGPTIDSALSITGTGRYFDIAKSNEQWTGKIWQSMYLNYTYEEEGFTHHVLDTLVFRDRGIKFEENEIQIIP